MYLQQPMHPSRLPSFCCVLVSLACQAVPKTFSCPARRGRGEACQGSVNVVPEPRLFASEPHPRWFGNPGNPLPGTFESKGWSNQNWLKSRFHFRFAEYSHGPGQFGVLKVMNDDLVQPRRGFGAHPHRDMEIVTFVVQGSLTHQDSTGIEETIGRGGIQYMTAGTGVVHSERNLQDHPLRFIQSWIVPRERGQRPNYGSMHGGATANKSRLNTWFHAASDVARPQPTPVKLNQDSSASIAHIRACGKLSKPRR